MRGEVPGVERRRRGNDDDKLAIVSSVGVSVTHVAHRHEVARQQIYKWWHELKKMGLWSPVAGAIFFPLDVPITAGVLVPQPAVCEKPRTTAVELRFGNGRCLRFDSCIDGVQLAQLIRAVEVT